MTRQIPVVVVGHRSQMTSPGTLYLTLEGHMYSVCPSCRKVVRTNKPLIGGLHYCEPRRVRR